MFGACGCVSTHFPLSEAVWAQVGYGEDGEALNETPFILRDIDAGLTVRTCKVRAPEQQGQ